MEYPWDLVDLTTTIGRRHPHHCIKCTYTSARILVGKPYSNPLENSIAIPIFTHLDGIRAFSSILGSDLALAQLG